MKVTASSLPLVLSPDLELRLLTTNETD